MAKSWPRSAKALNSSALPAGSRKNIVDCSPYLAFEAGIWLDNERHARRANTFGEIFPLLLREYDTEVRNRNVVAVDRVAVARSPVAPCRVRLVVRDDLMSEEIEVDPMLRAAPLGAPENGAVEVARSLDVVHGKGDVKRAQLHASIIPVSHAGGH